MRRPKPLPKLKKKKRKTGKEEKNKEQKNAIQWSGSKLRRTKSRHRPGIIYLKATVLMELKGKKEEPYVESV